MNEQSLNNIPYSVTVYSRILSVERKDPLNMEWWAYIWIFVSFAILLSLLETFHRRAKQKRAAIVEQELQSQIAQHQYHVYTIRSNQNLPTGNQYQHGIFVQQAPDMKVDDLPPKYEEVVTTLPQQQPQVHQQRSAVH